MKKSAGQWFDLCICARPRTVLVNVSGAS